MPSADRLQEFVTIVDLGSISAAARVLGVPRATLSRRLSSLEEELGVRLIHRETRRLVLTHAGEQLLGRARRLVEDTAETWQAMVRLDDTPRGRLRVSTPPTIFFENLILSFVVAYPQVEVQIVATPRTVDMVADGIDVALRFGDEFGPALVMRRLFQSRSSLVASRTYLERQGEVSTLEELEKCKCVLGFDTAGQPRSTLPLRNGGTVGVQSAFVADEMTLRIGAAMAGVGPTLLPDPLSEGLRKSGELALILPDEVGSTISGALVYPDRTVLLPQVRAFIDHAVEEHGDGSRLDTSVKEWLFEGKLQRR
ncbi:MAG: LysR substrate-binding domain-containing protein [Myxococcota bacterium]